jgi:AcrR family transcriptional regulator
MPGAKKKDDTQEILTAALSVFATKGFSKTSMADLARATGIPASELTKRFGTKEEVLISGFRWGQKQMEEELRPIISGGLDAHIALMFDAIMKGLAPFGPEIHLALIYQATQDKVLMEIIRRSSRNVNFAVKAYLAQMVALAIMESVDEVEKVNEEMVSSFVQYLAQTLQGKKIEAIKKQWVAHVRTMLKPSAKTTVPPI